jgi:hypothetical protein
LPVAREELFEAAGHYGAIEKRLGARLKEEARGVREHIRKNPLAAALRAGGYRRVNLRIFPYYFAYIVHGRAIWVLAFGHHARKPEYWIGRKGEIFRR